MGSTPSKPCASAAHTQQAAAAATSNTQHASSAASSTPSAPLSGSSTPRVVLPPLVPSSSSSSSSADDDRARAPHPPSRAPSSGHASTNLHVRNPSHNISTISSNDTTLSSIHTYVSYSTSSDVPPSTHASSSPSPAASPQLPPLHHHVDSNAQPPAPMPPPHSSPSGPRRPGQRLSMIISPPEDDTCKRPAPSPTSSPTAMSADLLSLGALGQALQAHPSRNSIRIAIDRSRRQQLEARRREEAALAPSAAAPASPLVFLPRGGIYVSTTAGPVQFGMVPETIKDSMKLGLMLPTVYVVPKQRFNLQHCLNVAEFEFPAYYNFFIKRRKVQLVTTHQVAPLLRAIFRETLLGPEHVEWPSVYSDATPHSAYPDLEKEMSFFRINPFDKTPLTIDTLLEFIYFDEQGVATIGDGVQIKDNGDDYVVLQNGVEHAHVPCDVPLPPPFNMSEEESSRLASRQFSPPAFGITMLGNSDGFDAGGTTTGFVLWLNRRGIMVDPPPHSSALLKKHGIPARLIRGVILTHCHSDHDGGTFSKILEETKVELMTTPVILESFLTKHAAISALDRDFLRRLFVFRPVLIGEKMPVFGGFIQFFYSLHSIPCIGFSAFYGSESMVYSADTFNDTAGINAFHARGLMSDGRRDQLLNFPWNRTVILHEAGVPPIHTPLTMLTALPDDVKQRLYIVHKPSKDVPADQGLKSALVGPENTIVITKETSGDGASLEILDLISTIELFNDLPLSRASELISACTRLVIPAGQTIIEEGTSGHTLFIVAMGTVTVSQQGKFLKHLTVGTHFGEMAIFGEERTATIAALTDVELLQFTTHDFNHIVRQTNVIEKIKQLSIIQKTESWQTINKNSVLSLLTSAQKTYLQSILQIRRVESNEVVWTQGTPAQFAILVASGHYVFERAADMRPFTAGSFIGDFKALMHDTLTTTTLICKEGGEVYTMRKEAFVEFTEHNPGFKVFFLNRRFVE